ncbi:hypothetical protein [Halapricum desulfuricans]|uniref:Uncharacterized protein n=1 Tax=Halapricum desulfuricans TaxID=2841257 RepID=A0A897MW86_9EURY|nr:hypothetical protein [Halapricum desulfuricans]QSG06380.1 hypothetical protein HSR121_2048 [Halapricum desulfuricans]
MTEIIAREGPFQLIELNGTTFHDYALTDQHETVYLGFSAEEQPDLLALLEQVEYMVEE